ncbi:MAG: type II toxin-antitoxin system VapC family toxin [Acidobacteria bacterium]|nr:type II toxin-antitoxin system VapC family toxin [Acidobacteriota bacterium]
MSSYVLDASVAAKWFLPPAGETLVPQSLSILQDYASGRTELLVPDLFWAEFGNILWKAVRAGRMSRASAEEAIATLARQSLSTSPSLLVLVDAFGVAATFQRSVYDCTYIALAVATGRRLLTADERLANALASRFPICWLGSVQTGAS